MPRGLITGNERDAACPLCGSSTTEREVTTLGGVTWSTNPHPAPCGAECMGGGLRGDRSTDAMIARIDKSHRQDVCGTEGCEGGLHAPGKPTLEMIELCAGSLNPSEAIKRHVAYFARRLLHERRLRLECERAYERLMDELRDAQKK